MDEGDEWSPLLIEVDSTDESPRFARRMAENDERVHVRICAVGSAAGAEEMA